jgi:hypothetical protein
MEPPNPYVARRMATRRISEEEIEQVFEARETTYQSGTHANRTVILGRTSDGRRLKIVVLTARPDYVVTVADRDEET